MPHRQECETVADPSGAEKRRTDLEQWLRTLGKALELQRNQDVGDSALVISGRRDRGDRGDRILWLPIRSGDCRHGSEQCHDPQDPKNDGHPNA